MSDKLQEIIATKTREIGKILPKEAHLKLAALERNDYRSLEAALRSDPDRIGLIAEVKKASPSAGVISVDFDPVQIALDYEKAGASALSVLTDEVYFQGRLDYMTRARQATQIPVLRKDFIIHEVQIYEAAVAGADAILLIVAALEQHRLEKLLETAFACNLEVLVEVHDLEELERALQTDARLIGINNRNLKTFQVDLATTEKLAEEVPDDLILISESGLKTAEDSARVARAGADAVLVGETLMRSRDRLVEVVEAMKALRLKDPRI